MGDDEKQAAADAAALSAAAKKAAAELQLQVSFAKDVVYGAVTLTLFSAFGWPQWALTLVHVLSVPGVLVPLSSARVLSAALVASLLATLIDVVSVLTFTCGLVDCCLPGAKAPAFALTMHVCDPALHGMQGLLVTVTAMGTVAVGATLSIARAVRIEVAAGGSEWRALAAVYVGLRVYQMTWLAQVMMVLPALMWVISGGIVLLVAASGGRHVQHQRSGRTGMLLYIAGAVDLVLMLIALSSGIVKPALQLAFYTVQTITSAVAIWQAHRASALPVVPSDAGGVTPRTAFKSRNLCL